MHPQLIQTLHSSGPQDMVLRLSSLRVSGDSLDLQIPVPALTPENSKAEPSNLCFNKPQVSVR